MLLLVSCQFIRNRTAGEEEDNGRLTRQLSASSSSSESESTNLLCVRLRRVTTEEVMFKNKKAKSFIKIYFIVSQVNNDFNNNQ